jgi:hypothetical protein
MMYMYTDLLITYCLLAQHMVAITGLCEVTRNVHNGAYNKFNFIYNSAIDYSSVPPQFVDC